jgi:alkylation response protein AidB-like acyl-CoA dehydrogenase
MDFQLSSEQAELSNGVRRLLDKTYEFEARKRIVASESGHSAEVWAQLAEMGVLGLAVPESRGGFATGADVAASLSPIMNVMGESLSLEPLTGNLVSAWLLSQCASSAQSNTQSDSVLEGIISGQTRVALSLSEEDSAAMNVSTSSDGLRVTGERLCVVGASQSSQLLINTHTPNRLLLIANNNTSNQDVTYSSIYRTVDNKRACDLSLSNASALELKPANGSIDDLVSTAQDLHTLLVCAEAVGCMRYACDATLDYLKTRKQFGQPIGAFQALQHRMVDMTMALELARSMVDLACTKFDAAMRGELSTRERQHYVSAAKIKISDAARHVGQEAIQLHGGMGMANEMKISHTFKRLTVIAQTFGDVDFHLARFAATDA